MFHPKVRLQGVLHLLARADELELTPEALQRLRWFAYALEHDGNVSLTCRHFGIARSTFLRWAERFDPRDPRTLEERSRRPHMMRQPETDPKVVELIRTLRAAHPLMGKREIESRLSAEHGLRVSSSTIGRVIARHGFFFADTPSHRAKRLQAGIDEPVDESSSSPREKLGADDAFDSPFLPATEPSLPA